MRKCDLVGRYSNPNSDHGKSAVPGMPMVVVVVSVVLPTSGMVADAIDVRFLLDVGDDDDDDGEIDNWRAETDDDGTALNASHRQRALSSMGRRVCDILMVLRRSHHRLTPRTLRSREEETKARERGDSKRRRGLTTRQSSSLVSQTKRQAIGRHLSYLLEHHPRYV